MTSTLESTVAEAIRAVIGAHAGVYASACADECARAAIAAMPKQKQDERGERVGRYYRSDASGEVFECVNERPRGGVFVPAHDARNTHYYPWDYVTEVRRVTKTVTEWEEVK